MFSALEESTKVGKIKIFLSILLMGFRNPVNSPVEGKVVEIPLFIRFYTSQVVVWDFFHHNSKEDLVFSLRNLPPTYTPRKFDRQLTARP